MAQLHTFTDFDLLPDQTSGLAYGPVVGNETTQYRVTSRFQLTEEDIKAYAVCDGFVFIHPVAGHTDLVNLIIKPSYLDDVGFTPVEYFVYRGLKKSNFVDESDDLIAKESEDATDLITEIYDTHAQSVIDSHETDNEITGSPSSDILGWDKRTDTSILIKDIFFANNSDNQLAFVSKGDYIGNFSFEEDRPVGFEIVLKERFFNPDINYLKTLEHIVTATAPGMGDIEGNEGLSNMYEREKILNFIDPAAYFSLWRDIGIDYKEEEEEAVEITEIEELYADIIDKFYTKNTVYIDIRNELGLSLNYYKDNQGEDPNPDFGKNFLLSVNTPINFSDTSTIEEKYYVNFWPIYSTDAINNPNPSDNFNDLYLSFRKKHNPEPVVYYDYAFKDDLTKLPVNEDRFHRDFNESDNADWSDEIKVTIPSIESITPSCIIKLMIAKLEQPDSLSLPQETFVRAHFLDGVFPVSDDLQLFSNAENQIIPSNGKVFINSYYELGFMGVAQTGIGVSENGVLLIASLIDFVKNPHRGSLSTDINLITAPAGVSFNGLNEWQLLKADFFHKIGLDTRRFLLEIDETPVYVTSFVSTEEETNRTGIVFSIGLLASQYADMITQAGTDSDLGLNHSNPRIGITGEDMLNDDNNHKYFSASISILGTGLLDSFVNKPASPSLQIYSVTNTSYNG